MLTFADSHWTWLDGHLQRQGIDIYVKQQEPLFRFVALLHSIVIERLANITDESVREEISRILEWPAVTEQQDLEESDRMARESMEALGIDPSAFLDG